jgi:uncharacterized protein (DUF433 family)
MGELEGGRDTPPVGWYLATDVAELVGVSRRSVVEWAKHGYIEPHRQQGPPHVFSYQDVAEAMVVHELLDRSVPRSEIRAIVRNCAEIYGAWPLQMAPLALYEGEKGSRAALIDESKGTVYDIGRGIGNQAFLPDLERLTNLAKQLRSGGWVVRIHPKITHIEVNPDVLSGKPSVLGHRVSVRQVAAMAAEPAGRRELRRGFDLTTAEINDAVGWVAGVAELQAAA